MTVHFTIEIDEALKAKLEDLAAARNETAAGLAVQAVRDLVDEDAHFRALVAEGMAAASEGRLTPHDEVMADLRQRRLAREAAVEGSLDRACAARSP